MSGLICYIQFIVSLAGLSYLGFGFGYSLFCYLAYRKRQKRLNRRRLGRLQTLAAFLILIFTFPFHLRKLLKRCIR